jgi:hypothetical protein
LKKGSSGFACTVRIAAFAASQAPFAASLAEAAAGGHIHETLPRRNDTTPAAAAPRSIEPATSRLS